MYYIRDKGMTTIHTLKEKREKKIFAYMDTEKLSMFYAKQKHCTRIWEGQPTHTRTTSLAIHQGITLIGAFLLAPVDK